jgi:squalene synthase HpnC
MPVEHYENFPVASLLLPRSLRRPVAVIYRFARTADDFADEGELSADERLARLEAYRGELRGLQSGRPPGTPLFAALGEVVRDYDLPCQPLFDLLDAFSQDVVKKRYASFAEVMDYCRRSADPVGRLMLHLYGLAGRPGCDTLPELQSDAICSALQLINFWQDSAIDYAKNRIYLPQDEMARYEVSESHIAEQKADANWAALMSFQLGRTRAMLESGAPLATRVPGRAGLELRMIVQGGRRILEKLERARGDVFRHRPVLRAWDWGVMFARALGMQPGKRREARR